MLRIDEVRNHESAWNKAGADEPLFILRPTDRNAPEVILHWISLSARNGARPEKLRAAFDLYLQALDWQKKHPELVKVPD